MKSNVDKLFQMADKLSACDNNFESKLLVQTATIWNEILKELKLATIDDKKILLKNMYDRAESISLYGKICIQASVVLELLESKYTNRFLSFLLNENTLSVKTAYFLRWQMLIALFPISKGKDHETALLFGKYYQKIFRQMIAESFSNLVEIKNEERDKDFVIVFTAQFLSIQHGPTKTTLDRVYTLIKKCHKKVLLINTAELSAKQGRVPLFQYEIGNYIEAYSRYTKIGYKDITIPFMQLPDDMLSMKQIQRIVRMVQRKKPYFIINIGGNSILADICSRLSPMLTISTIPSGLVTTEGQFQMIGHSLLEKEKVMLNALGKSEEHVIVGRFTSTVIEQKIHVSREELKIPDNKFVIVMIGGRLTYEITEDFMRFFMRFVPFESFFVFAGGMDQYDEFCEKIPQFQENSAFLGIVEDIFSVLEHCDLYVNPPRTGGGTSSVEAMYAGVPVVTYDIGDVPTNTGEEFVVKNEEEMEQMVKRYIEDKEFYHQKSEAARKRAAYMLDTDGAFSEILGTFFQRAGL